MVYVHVPCDKTVSLSLSLSLSMAGRRRIRIAGSSQGPGPGLLGFARCYPFPFDLPQSFLTALLAGKIDDLALWVSAEGRPDPVSPFMVKFPSPPPPVSGRLPC
jgi:hypothetical protein